MIAIKPDADLPAFTWQGNRIWPVSVLADRQAASFGRSQQASNQESSQILQIEDPATDFIERKYFSIAHVLEPLEQSSVKSVAKPSICKICDDS